jgi:putative phosphoesterase
VAYRIGVVSDTHVPEFAERLHEGLSRRFAGVDLILHAGDITAPETLAELEQIAPVVAVKGNHDASLDLPLRRVVQAGGKRIGLIHGHRGRVREFPGVAWNEAWAGHRFWWNGVPGYVLREFENDEVDAVVFGHIHRPLIEHHGPVMLFNPGATYHCQAGAAVRRLKRGGPLHHRLYYTSRARWPEGVATAGLLTISDGRIEPEVFELDGVPPR